MSGQRSQESQEARFRGNNIAMLFDINWTNENCDEIEKTRQKQLSNIAIVMENDHDIVHLDENKDKYLKNLHPRSV